MSVPVIAHAQSLTMHHRKTHLNVPHGGNKLECFCIYRNCYQLLIELSGRKGSVTYGLGADISLPPCLATGIWNLAPKATSGPKSRGASFGTTLWHHVQKYCCFGILLAHAQLPQNWSSYHIRGENIYLGSTKYNTPLMSFTGPSFFNKWIRISV